MRSRTARWSWPGAKFLEPATCVPQPHAQRRELSRRLHPAQCALYAVGSRSGRRDWRGMGESTNGSSPIGTSFDQRRRAARAALNLRGVSTGDDTSHLPAEARARVLIDRQLGQAGWLVQDKKALNLFAAPGVAVREVILKPGHGRVDYLLYVDQAAVGVIEAKPEGTPLSGVEWQSAMYADGLPADVRLAALTKDGRLPFVFEASGTETHFTNGFDPDPRARRVFQSPKPATLADVLKRRADEHPTWRGKVRTLPPLDEGPLRPAQITAIKGV